MKRINNLYDKILSIDNLLLADQIARLGKANQPGIVEHDKNSDQNIADLYRMLVTKTYKTSKYTIFKIFEPKEREIYRLPYFPDRITHHAIMNVLEPIFMASFTADTYSCIKGRGIHAAHNSLQSALRDLQGTKYCLKLDIKKFYPSVDHAILKQLLRRKFKDKELLWLLDGIIDSADGLPIGNYLSQYLANFYLSYFDHWVKEELKAKYYFRYADDLVFLSGTKADLHQMLGNVRHYLDARLGLQIKGNYQVFPVASRSIDFVGYRFYHTHILLRKSIKQNFARKVAKGIGPASLASYKGWIKHCNGRNLLKKLLPHEVI